MSVIRHSYSSFFHKISLTATLILRLPFMEINKMAMKNEINDPTNLTERLSKFDRELNPCESVKDDVILQHITRQTQVKVDLSKLDCQTDQ